jgi:hypothetical protein
VGADALSLAASSENRLPDPWVAGLMGTSGLLGSFSGKKRKALAMEHIAAVLLIVGCSSGFSDCRELPAPTALFETFEECEDVLPASLTEHHQQGLHVTGACVYVDPAAEEEDAELVWSVSPDGALEAEVVTGAMVARDGTAEDEASAF